MQLAIIEDNPSIQQLLISMVKNIDSLTLTFVADSIVLAKKEFERHQIDIVLMDIELKDGLSFELLNQLESPDFKIIFISAHGHYSLNAIRFSAIDYLLKPIDQQELDAALKRAIETRKKESKAVQIEEQLAVLQQLLGKGTSKNSKIMLPGTNEIVFLRLDQILRLEAQANYCLFHTIAGQKHLVSKPLKEYASLLLSFDQFVKVHKSHIINIDFVSRYNKEDGGTVIMEDESEIPVSRRNKTDLFESLNLIQNK